eukprot:CAMPEP_0196659630 /NCGR_PEP_ID=MMETSP1086-20130531/35944_1 /TAXON_ID=77921 /ORGANISM="Cyanoptyche  gloeocystis , Strain SAG4.97" /LENGTH=64 /DNA_ID=CAMNT_0041993687 /DNA_START=368 /DNA_END=562 /DNA_ORIENTATION=+
MEATTENVFQRKSRKLHSGQIYWPHDPLALKNAEAVLNRGELDPDQINWDSQWWDRPNASTTRH